MNRRRPTPPKRQKRAYIKPKRRVRTLEGAVDIREGVIHLMLPGKLKSLNQIKTWRARHGDTQAWEKRIQAAMKNLTTDGSVAIPVTGRMRLDIVRLIPGWNCFLDKTNLYGAVKGLEDALKRTGFIVDDKAKWLDGPYVEQTIAGDKEYWAQVDIRPADDV